ARVIGVGQHGAGVRDRQLDIAVGADADGGAPPAGVGANIAIVFHHGRAVGGAGIDAEREAELAGTRNHAAVARVLHQRVAAGGQGGKTQRHVVTGRNDVAAVDDVGVAIGADGETGVGVLGGRFGHQCAGIVQDGVAFRVGHQRAERVEVALRDDIAIVVHHRVAQRAADVGAIADENAVRLDRAGVVEDGITAGAVHVDAVGNQAVGGIYVARVVDFRAERSRCLDAGGDVAASDADVTAVVHGRRAAARSGDHAGNVVLAADGNDVAVVDDAGIAGLRDRDDAVGVAVGVGEDEAVGVVGHRRAGVTGGDDAIGAVAEGVGLEGVDVAGVRHLGGTTGTRRDRRDAEGAIYAVGKHVAAVVHGHHGIVSVAARVDAAGKQGGAAEVVGVYPAGVDHRGIAAGDDVDTAGVVVADTKDRTGIVDDGATCAGRRIDAEGVHAAVAVGGGVEAVGHLDRIVALGLDAGAPAVVTADADGVALVVHGHVATSGEDAVGDALAVVGEGDRKAVIVYRGLAVIRIAVQANCDPGVSQGL